MPTWLTALLPLLGVLVGASIQFVLTRVQARETALRAERADVYASFLRAQSQWWWQADNAEREAELAAQLLAAKARMAVYASRSVVQAHAAYLAAQAHDDPSQRAKYIRLCQEMRRDSLAEGQMVGDDEVDMVIYAGYEEDESP
jgi:hypothetical protein